MNFNFTSQICTSHSQSERLLALGLKKETADMRYRIHYFDLDGTLLESIHSLEPDPPLNNERFIPAWSLHRLMTLLMIGDKLGCITHNIHQNNISTYYELVITSIEHLIKIDEFNKEYLEE